METLPPLQDGPTVWYGPDIKGRQKEWLFELTPEEIKELGATADLIVSSSPEGSDSISLQHIESLEVSIKLPILSKRANLFLENNLLHGLGFFVWRGVPTSWDHKRLCAAFLLIGKCFGNLRRQNSAGHILGHVKDLGFTIQDPNVRNYQTNERNTFHVDWCDVVGLLCLKKAKSGGLSSIVSSTTVFNEMSKIDRELTAQLFKHLAMDRRGEIPEGAKPYFNLPVYTYHEQQLSAYYQRRYIDSAQRFPDVEKLTTKQIEALDLFDKLVNDPRLNFNMELEPGDMQFLHNHVILHDRTRFQDWDDEDRRRHLLRVWISPKKGRPLPQFWEQRYGSVVVGERGGVNISGVEPIAPLYP